MIHEATTNTTNNKQSQSATDVKTDMTDYIEFISNKYKSKLESNFKNKWLSKNENEKAKEKEKERIDDINLSIPKFNEY
jgi:LPS O-antigen subunit length determinant protein (WzzB/FepE family)